MNSIRNRLLASLLLVLTALLLGGGVAVYALVHHSLTDQFDGALLARAGTLASLVTFETDRLLFDDQDAAHLQFEGSCYEIRTISGELLVRSEPLGPRSLPVVSTSTPEPVIVDYSFSEGVRQRLVHYKFWPAVELGEDAQAGDGREGEPHGSDQVRAPEMLVVSLLEERSTVDEPMAALRGVLIVVGLLIEAALCVTTVLAVRWGMNPISHLAAAIAGVEGHEAPSQSTFTDCPAELKPFQAELNRMLTRVHSSLTRERLFSDAAAHELRTPLAELRAAVEVAQRFPDAQSAGELHEQMLAICTDLESLVAALLRVSRAQHLVQSQDSSLETAVEPVVQTLLEKKQTEVLKKRLRIRSDIDPRAVFPGSEEALRIILSNLIGNAVEHTSHGGCVAVGVKETESGSVVVSISNEPAGIDQSDLNRMFDPFWQRDRSRSDRAHLGLGLTVVDHVAKSVQAMVTTTLTEDTLTVLVSWQNRSRSAHRHH